MLTIYPMQRLFLCGLMGLLVLSGCKKVPPDYRPEVSLPVFTEGDADKGALIYDDACAQCHQLKAGFNKKGPQLMNIYGAKAGLLNDYKFSKALSESGWVWDAKTLDHYIADVDKALPDSKMLADPMPDARERADVIAYLSTLREVPPVIEEGEAVDKTLKRRPQMENEPVEIVEGEPAAAQFP
ncbi:c-type cytochrome [Psychrobacter ciconiae]|uniref:c-type cytochrome n=1 Tax=Psychrobacter ciconiae TaxID=1553449 RepID=UPI001D118D0A|nr:c-type cytochrome [Psychrobacter ciconiae]